MSEVLSNYRGSTSTAQAVAKEIERRWGKNEAVKYNPFQNCLTFKRWSTLGFRVKQGEKAINSFTFVEKKDEHNQTAKKYLKSVSLFYYLQVEKRSPSL